MKSITVGSKKVEVSDEKYAELLEENQEGESEIQIVILQRGWVYVGKFSQIGDMCMLKGAKVIRVWGTTKGIGELAKDGPTSSTKIDESPDVRFHQLTMIARMDVKEKNWNKYF